MKVRVEQAKSVWTPIEVKILLETREDAVGLKHAVGCWDAQGTCDSSDKAKKAAFFLHSALIDAFDEV